MKSVLPIFLLHNDPVFPDPQLADESGIIAIEGDLSEQRLLEAYRKGIFPWYNEGDPITWWSPDPRCILYPNDLHISSSMKRELNKGRYTTSFDTSFETVIRQCKSVPRTGQDGTWITDEMEEAYIRLHQSGYAHSVEVWEKDELVGGMYGISLGACFFGESMFSLKTNASKVAMVALVDFMKKKEFHFLDCQVYNDHLASLGATEIPRERFLQELIAALMPEDLKGDWKSFA